MKQLILVLLSTLALFISCDREPLPEVEIDPSTDDLYFPPLTGENWETTSFEEVGWNTDTLPALLDFLQETNTRAFLIIKNGKIVIEEYFDKDLLGKDFDKDSYWYWASAGKTLTSFLVGKAQEEGYLSIDDRSADYLGENWTTLEQDLENAIQIIHQLTMTSGLDDAKDPHCTDPECLTYKATPGTRWAYHNAPYTLLDGVIEGATKIDFDDYFNSKLRDPIGMKGFWSYLDYNHVYFSDARSMARFGLLMLNNGDWENKVIMKDKAYLASTINTSQEINPSYGYLWWLNGKPSYMIPGIQFSFNQYLTDSAPGDMYAAMGKNGQLLNIVPSENMIMVRMGDNPDLSLVPSKFQKDVWEHISALIGED